MKNHDVNGTLYNILVGRCLARATPDKPPQAAVMLVVVVVVVVVVV